MIINMEEKKLLTDQKKITINEVSWIILPGNIKE